MDLHIYSQRIQKMAAAKAGTTKAAHQEIGFAQKTKHRNS
jgi:hypothetical protein